MGTIKRIFSVSTALLLFSLSSQATEYCHAQFGGMSLSEAIHRGVEDSDSSKLVVLTEEDMDGVVKIFTPRFRPDFTALAIENENLRGQTVIALVPIREHQNIGSSKTFIGQQVVQFQRLNVAPEDFIDFKEQGQDGALVAYVKKEKTKGVKVTEEEKTGIILTKPLKIEPISFNVLKNELINSPGDRVEVPGWKFWARRLFGTIGDRARQALEKAETLKASEDILETTRILNPGKIKVLHVMGEIFHAKLTVNEASPYSGTLAPGEYFVLGRLSSALKTLDMKNDNGRFEPNSLAMALLIFRTQDQAEVPGVLLVQDSLSGVVNPGLTQYGMTNNPHFAFHPKDLGDFFEQGFAAAGVALASLKSSRDSGRKLQGNYRSNFGAASNGVDLTKGEYSLAPRYISIQFSGNLNEQSQTHQDSMAKNKKGSFIIKASNNGTKWNPLGVMTQIKWMGIDRHALTFPHGLSGNIDPQTLRVGTSQYNGGGIEVPLKVEREIP